MARPKGNYIVNDSRVAQVVTDMLNAAEKTQEQVSKEMGFERASVMTMMKSGRTKFPMARIMQFCRSTGGDPEVLLDAILEEYHPELLDAMTAIKGRVVSKDERKIITAIRDAKRDKDEKAGKTGRWNITEGGLKKLGDAVVKILY